MSSGLDKVATGYDAYYNFRVATCNAEIKVATGNAEDGSIIGTYNLVEPYGAIIQGPKTNKIGA